MSASWRRAAGPTAPALRLIASVVLTAMATWAAPATPGWAAPDGTVLDLAALQNEQRAVVTANHQPAVDQARLSVERFTAAVAADQQALGSAESSATAARSSEQAATARLADDRSALTAATAVLDAAESRLAQDRGELRAIAVGMYTGELTNPRPASLQALEADQEQAIFSAEVETVAQVVDSHLGRDLQATRQDAARRAETAAAVAADGSALGSATADTERSAALVSTARAVLADDTTRLGAAEQGLATADASLAAALAALAGPASASARSGLSLVGGSALDAAELVQWYNSQGYLDLTSAPVEQLAAWYLSAGQAEGVRGDVAFAQAVLETGGFASPDSVTFNNYAGIGHCDSCSTGWAFPSPQAGVLGQEQLLRIFADGAPPASGPRPALSSLTPAGQSRSGCCPTWEALTGVWASDPSYGTQILDIYRQMLEAALRHPRS